MKISLKFPVIIFIAILFIIINLNAQWSNDPNVNLQVCDVSGEQALTKVAACPDGGCYISWFDHRGSSYAVYLQKLNALGVKQFAADGILISNNPQNSSLVDYDLICDDANNAVIVFTDIRNGSSINPFAYKVSPSGTMLWGANGITLSDSVNSFQPNPKVVKSSDGNFIFVWRIGSGPTKIAMQKLNSAGIKQWGASPILISSGTAENYDWPSEVSSDNGSIILYWCGYTGSFISPANYRLYTQKFSSSGTRVWNSTQDTVYSLGRVSGFYTPQIFPDGSNGAIFVWQDDRFATNQTNSYVHRINSAGVFLFPVNGSAVAGTSGWLRFAPIASVTQSNQETYVFWQEKNTTQSLIGLFGQKFSPGGTRLWNDAGAAFKPLDGSSFSSLAVHTKDTNVFVSYLELPAGVNGLIKAFRTGPSGAFGWGGAIITPGSLTSEKLRMSAALSPNGMSMLAWQDKRNDGGGIYAQNINIDGTFGNPQGIEPVSGNLPERFSLYQNYPNPFNPTTKIRFSVPSAPLSSLGEGSGVRLIIYDILGREIAVLVNEHINPGTYEVTWDASNQPAGVYFYKITSGEYSETRKMILIK